MGDVFLRIFSPLQALATLAPLCKSTLIVSQPVIDSKNQQPVMHYFGGEERNDATDRTWWVPNVLCFKQMLKRVGFENVSVECHNTNLPKPQVGDFNRAIIHATK